ncbi:AAA family ATPase [Brevibacillus centrosporus]|uniref:AAA family ATPase n=1 Tax=Brevibacillus centrosporus TaxID=54910 RepID=UPI000F0A913B|nr:AAA family ATPase [Brevibacillus centrosporus]MEC2133391.1 AAA family ATPase [Brevibacillus centrosporus]RNB62637.1 ATPase [Brevibacillus centrosporus]GED35070.1 hypothetical protein BCE02nite_62110 [Brevibacillus centrosporus]
MIIRFQKLSLKNFKSHRDLVVEFGDLTKISGDNAKGKSSIPEAISWTLYGTDVLGSKLDPTPIGYDFDEVKVELLFSVDDKQILLGRGIEDGKATYYINESTKTFTVFDELVKSIIDKDLFLSLFNPTYFFTMQKNEQRELLLRSIAPPTNKEVFKHLPDAQAAKLEELFKQKKLADLLGDHKKNKAKQNEQYIAARSRTKTLLEQLDSLPATDVDIEEAKAKIAALDDQITEIERSMDAAAETNRQYTALKAQIKAMQEQISASAAKWPALRDEQIADTCRTCKQPLQDEAVQAVTDDKERRVHAYKEQHAALVAKRKEAEAQLATLEYIDVSEQHEKIRTLEQDKLPLLDALKACARRDQLEYQIEQAKVAEAETLASRNESIFILDTIKAFQAKEAELQATKVQDLFTSLSISLFKLNKTDGEYKPDFEIEMDGKPYRKLSLSESIRAGLELRDVLSQQSGIVAPCFVDNAESITRFTQPNGQLIMCRVVAGQELKIEMEDEHRD